MLHKYLGTLLYLEQLCDFFDDMYSIAGIQTIEIALKVANLEDKLLINKTYGFRISHVTIRALGVLSGYIYWHS